MYGSGDLAALKLASNSNLLSQFREHCRIALYRIKAPPLAARAVWRCTSIHPGTPGIRFAAPVGRAALRAGPQAPADGPPDPSLIRPRLPTSASMVTQVGCARRSTAATAAPPCHRSGHGRSHGTPNKHQAEPPRRREHDNDRRRRVKAGTSTLTQRHRPRSRLSVGMMAGVWTGPEDQDQPTLNSHKTTTNVEKRLSTVLRSRPHPRR
jgi:hypothetical protein